MLQFREESGIGAGVDREVLEMLARQNARDCNHM
jgi:hypothetical protein